MVWTETRHIAIMSCMSVAKSIITAADVIRSTASTFEQAGAEIDYDARPDFTAEHSHTVYQYLLWATMASRMAKPEYDEIKDFVGTLSEDDHSDAASLARAQTASFKDWSAMNEARTHLRWAWHSFFTEYDILLTPMMATAAFQHNHAPMGQRTINVDGEERSYFEQLFWAGLTGVSYLPSTIVPTGPNDSNLPIGVQIAGPEYADMLTIQCAEFLEQNGYNFVAPAAYSDT